MKSAYPGTRRAWGILGIGIALALVSGCGGPFTAAVSGKVTYKGTPLPGGLVTFIHPDGRIGQGQIQPDGTYTVANAPGGDVKCTVHTFKPDPKLPPKLAAKLPGGAKPAEAAHTAAQYVHIPDKYGSAATSGLAYTISRGSQTIEITLSD